MTDEKEQFASWVNLMLTTLAPSAHLDALCYAGLSLLQDKKQPFKFNKKGEFWQRTTGGAFCDKPQGIGGGACGECDSCLRNIRGGYWSGVSKYSQEASWVGVMVEVLWPFHIELVRDEGVEEGFRCFTHVKYTVTPPLSTGGVNAAHALAKGVVILSFDQHHEEMKKVWEMLEAK